MSSSDHPLIQHLANRLAGYAHDQLELILATTCAGRALLLTGRHGLGKTVLVGLLCAIFRFSTRFYCAAKDDLVTGMAGIPSPTALAEGRLEWAAHDRTLWTVDGSVIDCCFIDELGRAPRGEQSCYLEVIDARTLFGRKLQLKTVFAATNPENDRYESHELDAALVDRFDLVLPVPEPAGSSLSVLTRVATVNLCGVYKSDAEAEEAPDGRSFLNEFRDNRDRLLEDTELCGAVAQWAARLVHEAQQTRSQPGSDDPSARTDEVYISFRTLARLPNVVLDLIAYQQTAHGTRQMLSKLVESAELVSQFAVATKCAVSVERLCRAQTAARPLLKNLAEARLREFDRLRPLSHGTLKSRISALEWLNLKEPHPGELHRLTMLVGQLVNDVSALLEQGPLSEPVPVGRLWHNLERYPEQRHALELSILRHRLNVSTCESDIPDQASWAPWTFQEAGRA
jgi:MoxR-like ATPase